MGAVKTVKKLLIPIVALLAFSMLCTSASANMPYYMASFYGEAEGCCWVYMPPDPEPTAGKGSVQVRGLAIVNKTEGGYFAWQELEPNTRLWTRRTRMTASWNNEKLTVWMWPSYTVWGLFNDTIDYLTIYNMSYFGYYKGETGLEFIMGNAIVIFILVDGAGGVPMSEVVLLRGADPFLVFAWLGGEIAGPPPGRVTEHIIRSVTVWGPIPWHPSGP